MRTALSTNPWHNEVAVFQNCDSDTIALLSRGSLSEKMSSVFSLHSRSWRPFLCVLPISLPSTSLTKMSTATTASAAAYSIYNRQTFGLSYISQTTICSSILHLQHTDIWFVLYLTNIHLQQHTPSTTHRHLVCTISHKQPSAAAYSIYNTQTFGLYYISQTTICSTILHLQHTDIWFVLYLTNNHLQQHTPSTTDRHLVCTISHKQPSAAAYSIYNTQTFFLWYISQITICSSILHLQHTDIWLELYLTNNHLQQHTPSTTHRHLVRAISHKQPCAGAYSIYNTQTFGLYYISQITMCSSILHLQHTDIGLSYISQTTICRGWYVCVCVCVCVCQNCKHFTSGWESIHYGPLWIIIVICCGSHIYLFWTPNSRSVFRAGVSLNIHSFIHVVVHTFTFTRLKQLVLS